MNSIALFDGRVRSLPNKLSILTFAAQNIHTIIPQKPLFFHLQVSNGNSLLLKAIPHIQQVLSFNLNVCV